MFHEDDYFKYTGPYRRERNLNVLRGILKGVSYNGAISDGESQLLHGWAKRYATSNRPDELTELAKAVQHVANSRQLDEDTKNDLLNTCRTLIANDGKQVDGDKADMQQLHGVLGGIASSGNIDQQELDGVREWLIEHKHLQGLWPYDEVDAIITSFVQKQGDANLERYLLGICGEFIYGNALLILEEATDDLLKSGVCASCPDVIFEGHAFCVSGRSSKCERSEFSILIEHHGGRFTSNISKKTDYLVVCAEGNAAWAFQAYGRKIEQAMNLRRSNHRITLVHENDFWDAIADM